MGRRILVGAAWPYANGDLHLGHIAGAYLPADIFARFHRLLGDEVLMVSGSDCHGTPVTIRAEREGRSPREIAEFYHYRFLDVWKKLDISFDLFTTTMTENHARTVKDIILKLSEKGLIYRDEMLSVYCPSCGRFLPDRYIRGVCPFCGNPEAWGDQCEECGRSFAPQDLRELRCEVCGGAPEFRKTEHLFFRLSALSERLREWISRQERWRPNVRSLTHRYLSEGLRDRAITRDIEWGIEVPFPGFERKRVYVWFEAVIGYLSATKEWAQRAGEPRRWRDFWSGEAESYYFVGKDNIPFHTIMWPAILMACGDLNLPTDVPANEFLTLEGRKISTSRGWAVWISDMLERYDSDAIRFCLAANMPETGDADFSFREFVRRNNDELVATYGNLAHRALTFVQRYFDGRVPEPGELDGESRELLRLAEQTFKLAGESLEVCRFREALRHIMFLAQEGNRYMERKAPWKAVKEDRKAAAEALFTILGVLSALRTLFYPFLPRSSERLSELLGFRKPLKETGWKLELPSPGTPLPPPKPLFRKLEGVPPDLYPKADGRES